MTLLGGYEVFLKGKWDVPSFLFSYLMVAVVPVLFLIWKIVKKTTVRVPHSLQSLEYCLNILRIQWVRLEDITFFEQERAVIDAYEANTVFYEPKTPVARFVHNWIF